MRLSGILVLVLLGIFSWGFGQMEPDPLTARIDFKVDQVSLQAALEQLADQVDKDLAYSRSFLNTDHRVTLDVQQEAVGTVLEKLLEGTGLGYKVFWNRILLFKLTPGIDPNQQAVLSGYVRDESSGEALVNAIVLETGSGKGVLTNEYGYFSLELGTGKHPLEIRYVGYETQLVEVNMRSNRQLNLSLSPDLLMEEVVITPDLQDGKLVGLEAGHPLTLSADLVENSPGLGGAEDLVRAAHLLPGVQAGVDGMAGLQVRGGESGQNLLMLDGVPVFIPFHLLGAYSVYNASAVKSAKLYKGAIPARFGGRSSAILDVRTREGNLQRWQGEAGANLAFGHALIEGPLAKEKVGMLLSARFAPTSRLLGGTLKNTYFQDPAGELETPFFDLNLKLNYLIGPRDRLYLSFFTGSDHFAKETETEVAGNDQESEQELNWGNTTASLRWNHLFNDRLFVNTTLTYSRFQYALTSYDRFTPVDSVNPVSLYFLNSRSVNTHVGIQSDFDLYANPEHTLRFGGGLAAPRFSPGFTYLDQDDTDVNQDRASLEELAEGELTEVVEGHIYGEDQWKPNDQFTANLGLRTSFFLHDDARYLFPEPRISLRWQPAQKLSLLASGSRMVQYLHLVSNTSLRFPNDLWITSDENTPPQDVWMTGIGAGYQFSPALKGSVEGFFRSMNNLQTLPDGFSFLTDADLAQPSAWLISGKGTAYGVEALAVYNDSKTGGMLSYTVSQSVRQFDSLNLGQAFPHAMDRRHQFKGYVSREWVKGLETGMNFVWYSGGPQIALAGVRADQGLTRIEINAPGARNALRGPAYHRLDMNLSYRFQTGKVRHRLKLSVFNAYDRKNVAFYESDGNGGITPVEGIGIRPGGGYTVWF